METWFSKAFAGKTILSLNAIWKRRFSAIPADIPKAISADPAPLPFPAPPAIPDLHVAAHEARAAARELMAEGMAVAHHIRAALTADAITPEALRGWADDLDGMAEAATAASRAIHDAAPDVLPAPCERCNGRRFIQWHPHRDNGTEPCPVCRPASPRP